MRIRLQEYAGMMGPAVELCRSHLRDILGYLWKRLSQLDDSLISSLLFYIISWENEKDLVWTPYFSEVLTKPQISPSFVGMPDFISQVWLRHESG